MVSENVPFVPFVTVMSPVTKPLTASEKVNVAVKSAVTASVGPVIATVGSIVSTVELFVAVMLPAVLNDAISFPAASSNTLPDDGFV